MSCETDDEDVFGHALLPVAHEAIGGIEGDADVYRSRDGARRMQSRADEVSLEPMTETDRLVALPHEDEA